MDDYGIKPEWREQWTWAHGLDDGDEQRELADLSAHLLAGWMRERFEREHPITKKSMNHWELPNYDYCQICGSTKLSNIDPRHTFTAAAWERVAREELGK